MAFPDSKMFLHFSNLHLGHSSWFSSPTGNYFIFTFSGCRELLHSHFTTISCQTNSQIIPPLFFKYLQLPTTTINIMWSGFTLTTLNHMLFFLFLFFNSLGYKWLEQCFLIMLLPQTACVVLILLLLLLYSHCQLKNSRWSQRSIFFPIIFKYWVSVGRK